MAFTVFSHQQRKKRDEFSHSYLPDQQFDLVMCFGTFDIFHPGHEFYLTEAQRFARKMIVVIARDHRVQEKKGKAPLHHEIDRRNVVQERFPEAQVILGDEEDIYAPIHHHHPDILAFGYDQYVPEERLRVIFPGIAITWIPGFETDKYKSSLLRDQ